MKRAAILIILVLVAIMAFNNVSSSNSDAQNWMQVNDLAREVKAKDITTVYKDESGTRRVLEGKGKDDFYGLKVSPAGVDVYDATDDQLVFNSNQNVFKIVSSGYITSTQYTISGTAGQWNVSAPGSISTVTHDLGFIPAVIAFVQVGSLWQQMPATYNVNVSTSAVVFETSSITVSSTTIGVLESAQTNGAVAPYTSGGRLIKYFLLQETAN